MSDESLDRVISRLKVRGIQAGADEGARLLEMSKRKGDQIVSDAEAEAERILTEANRRSAAVKIALEAELRQAADAGIEAFRQAVIESFLLPAVADGVKQALGDPRALTEIIAATAAGIAQSDGRQLDLEVLLPQAQRGRLEGVVEADLMRRARSGVTVRFEDGFEFGFRIAPSGSSYVFDFSEERLNDVFLKYLGPRFRERFLSSG